MKTKEAAAAVLAAEEFLAEIEPAASQIRVEEIRAARPFGPFFRWHVVLSFELDPAPGDPCLLPGSQRKYRKIVMKKNLEPVALLSPY